MKDLIERQEAIDAICKACSMEGDYHKCDGYPETSTWCDELVALRALPSAQPETEERTAESAQNVPNDELISKKAAIDAMMTILDKPNHAEFLYTDEICKVLNELPSAQPEPCDDAVSRAAVIDLIEASDLDLADRMDNQAVCSFVKMMPPFTPKTDPQWIPCSERLPEDDTEVFVYLFDRPSPYIAWVTDSCWFTEEFQVEKENYPKAWMPLPEPYRGEGE